MRLIVDINGRRQEYPLHEGAMTIGRGLECDITIVSASVSRRHSVCTFQNGQLSLRDLGSRNGTFVNGRPVQEAVVHPGETVRLGKVILRFVEADEAVPLQAPPAATPDAQRPTTEEVAGDAAADEALMPLIGEVPPQPLPPQPPPPSPAVPPPPAPPAVTPGELRLETERTPEPMGVPMPPAAGAGSLVPGVPDAAGFVDDDQPTPAEPSLDAQAPPSVPPGALVPVSQAAAGSTEVPAHTVSSQPHALKKLSPRMRLALAAVVATTLMGIGVIWLHKARQQRAREGNRVPLKTYNHNIDRAVDMAKEGNDGHALKLLKKLAERGTVGNRQTAQIFVDALTHSHSLRNEFEKRWVNAQNSWEELAKYSGSTQKARTYAQERLQWIERESYNMARFKEAQAAYKKNDYANFFKFASKISSDSIFLEALKQTLTEAQGKMTRDFTAQAQRAEAEQKWQDAVAHLRTIAQYVPAMRASLEPRIAKLQDYERQRQDLARASRLLDQSKTNEATTLLRPLVESGPYREPARKEMQRATRIEAERDAARLYDGGSGSRAIALLKQVNAESEALGRRIASVMERYEAMNRAVKNVRYTLARTAAQQIQQLENNPRNWYRLKADALLGNVEAERQKKARELVEEAKAAHDREDYRRARQLVDEATKIHPQSVGAASFRGVLKKEAEREYNRALQFRHDKPSEALKIFQQVIDRLRPNDTFYDRTQNRIRECKQKLKAPVAP